MRALARTNTSRRNLLGLGVAAGAAMGIAALTQSRAHAAARDNLVLGEVNQAGQEPTTVNAGVAGPAAAFYVTNTAGTGAALVGSSTKVRGAGTTGPYGALTGDTSRGYGVVGRAAPGKGGVGLFGFNEKGFGLEVFGANKFSQAGTATVAAGEDRVVVNDLSLQIGKDAIIFSMPSSSAMTALASPKRPPSACMTIGPATGSPMRSPIDDSRVSGRRTSSPSTATVAVARTSRLDAPTETRYSPPSTTQRSTRTSQ